MLCNSGLAVDADHILAFGNRSITAQESFRYRSETVYDFLENSDGSGTVPERFQNGFKTVPEQLVLERFQNSSGPKKKTGHTQFGSHD